MFRLPLIAARLAGLLMLACTTAQAAPPEVPAAATALRPPVLLTNAFARPGQDLAGLWTYSKDRYKASLANIHGEPPELGRQLYRDIDVTAAENANRYTFFEGDLQRAPRMQIPGSWNLPNTELRFYDGLIWFQRRFTPAPLPAGQRAFLRFEAVNYQATVFLNGKLLGRHEGGFTPFTFEVTQLVRPGENHVTVAVDSARNDENIPPTFTDWELYGGITRSVKLVYTPRTYIDDEFIRLEEDGSISATVKLDGPDAAQQPVEVAIAALGVKVSGKTDANGEARLRFPAPAALKRWTPEQPQLYDVSIAAGPDRMTERMGFRTIKVVGRDILLNGKPVFLRGVSMHEEEFGPTPARIITPQAARALLSEVKHGLGGNYVRLSHYPHSELTVRLADEMGLLVWSEIPVYWSVDFKSPKALATARRMMAENILRDRNRASIFVWSVGNETPGTPERLSFQTTLVDDTRALDPTRLVSAALWASKKKVNGRIEARIEDPLADKLDLLAINTYNAWYGDDTLEDLAAMHWHDLHGKPLLLSEFGADAKAGFHDTATRRKFSEEFQADYYTATLQMAGNIGFLRGMSPWILKDFQSPRREHPIYQNGWNRKGVVSETGERKLAFKVLADYFKAKAEGARP